ncbi:MAG: aspartyl-tRNA(Asn)/glutamyl-tRNA(Gln) amidotransferase subunit [Solirubrobacteraceae bacterium]|nr:aspartyl-tRNA(Asn)/glutamyl-tRNA(Gln) amidotransferase subunit [Solirubrobacteraceae bacterium]
MTERLDAVATAAAVREGHLSAAEVVTAALDRIEESGEELKAFVHVASRSQLEREADAIDRCRTSGQALGPLAGVPVGVKDVEDVVGMPTSFGSKLSGESVAAADSPHVARLRAAGAIVIGKTNTPEFAYSVHTRNRRFGETVNPADPGRVVGGSSGGSAAAVAAGLVPLATGSDGGGSIRIPAAFCGLPGLKPSYGRIPAERDGWGELTHVGALTGSLRDQARYLDVAGGPASVDRLSLPRADHSFEEQLGRPLELAGIRVKAFATLCGAHVAEEVAGPVATAIERLRAAGLDVTPAEDDLPDIAEQFTDLASYTDGARTRDLGPAEEAQLTRGYLAWCRRGRDVTVEDLVAAEGMRQRLFEMVEQHLKQAEFLLSPTVGILPWRPEQPPDMPPTDYLLTYPFNLTGHPALTVPLPGVLAGLQVVGRRFCEADLLRLGAAIEDCIA